MISCKLFLKRGGLAVHFYGLNFLLLCGGVVYFLVILLDQLQRKEPVYLIC